MKCKIISFRRRKIQIYKTLTNKKKNSESEKILFFF